jgi:hypothetical protein
MKETRNTQRSLLGKPAGKRSLARHGRRCEDNIKIDLREIVCEDWMWVEVNSDLVH